MILDCKDFVVAFYTIFAETCMEGTKLNAYYLTTITALAFNFTGTLK